MRRACVQRLLLASCTRHRTVSHGIAARHCTSSVDSANSDPATYQETSEDKKYDARRKLVGKVFDTINQLGSPAAGPVVNLEYVQRWRDLSTLEALLSPSFSLEQNSLRHLGDAVLQEAFNDVAMLAMNSRGAAPGVPSHAHIVELCAIFINPYALRLISEDLLGLESLRHANRGTGMLSSFDVLLGNGAGRSTEASGERGSDSVHTAGSGGLAGGQGSAIDAETFRTVMGSLQVDKKAELDRHASSGTAYKYEPHRFSAGLTAPSVSHLVGVIANVAGYRSGVEAAKRLLFPRGHEEITWPQLLSHAEAVVRQLVQRYAVAHVTLALLATRNISCRFVGECTEKLVSDDAHPVGSPGYMLPGAEKLLPPARKQAGSTSQQSILPSNHGPVADGTQNDNVGSSAEDADDDEFERATRVLDDDDGATTSPATAAANDSRTAHCVSTPGSGQQNTVGSAALPDGWLVRPERGSVTDMQGGLPINDGSSNSSPSIIGLVLDTFPTRAAYADKAFAMTPVDDPPAKKHANDGVRINTGGVPVQEYIAAHAAQQSAGKPRLQTTFNVKLVSVGLNEVVIAESTECNTYTEACVRCAERYLTGTMAFLDGLKNGGGGSGGE